MIHNIGERARVREGLGIVGLVPFHEAPRLVGQWTIEKYDVAIEDTGLTPDEFRAAYSPVEVLYSDPNLLLNEGINALLTLLIGGAETAYSNANARIGVGNSATAASASQTALQGGSTAFKAMDATFPTVSAQTVTFRSTFGTADGNFAWEEGTVDNGSTPNKNLGRKVQSMGTKASGTTWIASYAISIS